LKLNVGVTVEVRLHRFKGWGRKNAVPVRRGVTGWAPLGVVQEGRMRVELSLSAVP